MKPPTFTGVPAQTLQYSPGLASASSRRQDNPGVLPRAPDMGWKFGGKTKKIRGWSLSSSPFIYSISMLFWAISRDPNQGVRKQETMKPKRSVNTSVFGWWDGHLNSQPSHLLQVPSDLIWHIYHIYIYIIIYIWCVYIYTHGISVFGYLLAAQVAWNIFAIERATGLFRSTS